MFKTLLPLCAAMMMSPLACTGESVTSSPRGDSNNGAAPEVHVQVDVHVPPEAQPPSAPALICVYTRDEADTTPAPRSGVTLDGDVMLSECMAKPHDGGPYRLAFVNMTAWVKLDPRADEIVVDDLLPGERREYTVLYKRNEQYFCVTTVDQFGNPLGSQIFLDDKLIGWGSYCHNPAFPGTIAFQEHDGFTPEPISGQALTQDVEVMYVVPQSANVCVRVRNVYDEPLNASRAFNDAHYISNECAAIKTGRPVRIRISPETQDCVTQEEFRIADSVLREGETYEFPLYCLNIHEVRRIHVQTLPLNIPGEVFYVWNDQLVSMGWSFSREEPASAWVPRDFTALEYGDVEGHTTSRANDLRFMPQDATGEWNTLGWYDYDRTGLFSVQTVDEVGNSVGVPVQVTTGNTRVTYSYRHDRSVTFTVQDGRQVSVEFGQLDYQNNYIVPESASVTGHAGNHEVIVGRYLLRDSGANIMVRVASHDGVALIATAGVQSNYNGHMSRRWNSAYDYTEWLRENEEVTFTFSPLPYLITPQPLHISAANMPREAYNQELQRYEFTVVYEPQEDRALNLVCMRVRNENGEQLLAGDWNSRFSGMEGYISEPEWDRKVSCAYVDEEVGHQLSYYPPRGYVSHDSYYLPPGGAGWLASQQWYGVTIFYYDLTIVPHYRAFRVCLAATNSSLSYILRDSDVEAFHGALPQASMDNHDRNEACLYLDVTKRYVVLVAQRFGDLGYISRQELPGDDYSTQYLIRTP